MRGIADKAFARGFNVVLLNQRNCGGTEHLSRRALPLGADRMTPTIVIRELSARRHRPRRRRRLFARRQPRAEARRATMATAAPPSLRGVCAVSPGHGARGVRARARAAAELRLPVEFRAGPEGPHAPQGASRFPGRFPSIASRKSERVRAVRRAVHRAAFRLRRRRRLLPSRQRHARHRSHPRAGAHHHRRRRSVRAGRSIPRSAADGQPAHHAHHHAARRPLRVRLGRRRRRTTGIGPKDRSWTCERRVATGNYAPKLPPSAEATGRSPMSDPESRVPI